MIAGPVAPRDSFPDTLERAATAFLRSGLSSGRDQLNPMAGQLWWGLPANLRLKTVTPNAKSAPGASEKRPPLNEHARAVVFQRDKFQCRYCGTKTVLRSFAALMAELYPEAIPYHVHYKQGSTHSLFWTRCAEADHLHAGGRGGSWNDPSNLVTACALCNTRKAAHDIDDLDWSLRPAPASTWDGLTGLYRDVWEKAGQPSPSRHRPWLRALRI